MCQIAYRENSMVIFQNVPMVFIDTDRVPSSLRDFSTSLLLIEEK